MNSEADFFEKYAEILTHPEFDMNHVIDGLKQNCIEELQKTNDERFADVWKLLNKAQKVLEEPST